MLNYKPTEQDKLYAAFCKGYETAHKHFVTNKTPIMEQQTLTKEEAIKALREGKKLSHRYFDSWEWIRQEGFTMIMEDGASIDTDTFWKDRDSTGFLDGWYIKEETLKPSHFTSKPFGSFVKRSEVETVAANIMKILKRTGDIFRDLSWDEYKEERLKDGGFSETEGIYFSVAIPNCISAEKAKSFSPVWNKVKEEPQQTLREKAIQWYNSFGTVEILSLQKKYGYNREYSTYAISINDEAKEDIYIKEHPQDTKESVSVEDAAEKFAMEQDYDFESPYGNGYEDYKNGFRKGASWQKESNATEWELALISLTPSGSEFCGDSKRCVQFVRDFQAGQHKQIVDLTVKLKGVKALEDSHKELLEALKKLYNSIDSCIDLTHEILLKSKLAIETANKLTIK